MACQSCGKVRQRPQRHHLIFPGAQQAQRSVFEVPHTATRRHGAQGDQGGAIQLPKLNGCTYFTGTGNPLSRHRQGIRRRALHRSAEGTFSAIGAQRIEAQLGVFVSNHGHLLAIHCAGNRQVDSCRFGEQVTNFFGHKDGCRRLFK